MKQEKNDKVSLNISQTAIVLIIAMVFTGLSIQIDFIVTVGGGRMRGSKIPVQELWLIMGGGVIAGFYGNLFVRPNVLKNRLNFLSMVCDIIIMYSGTSE